MAVTQICASETMENVVERGSKKKSTAVLRRRVRNVSFVLKRVKLTKADIDGKSFAACLYSIMNYYCFHSDE